MPENYQGAAFLIAGALLLLGFGLIVNRRTAKAEKLLEALPWEVKKEGVFEEVQYGEQDHVRRERRGAMVHSTHEIHYKAYYTFLYFADGSSFVLDGLRSIQFSRGTKIQILTKGGDYKYAVVGA